MSSLKWKLLKCKWVGGSNSTHWNTEISVTLHILVPCGFVRCQWASVVLTCREHWCDMQGISRLTANKDPKGNEAILLFLRTTNSLNLTFSQPNIHFILTLLETCISVYGFQWTARCSFDASVYWGNRIGIDYTVLEITNILYANTLKHVEQWATILSYTSICAGL